MGRAFRALASPMAACSSVTTPNKTAEPCFYIFPKSQESWGLPHLRRRMFHRAGQWQRRLSSWTLPVYAFSYYISAKKNAKPVFCLSVLTWIFLKWLRFVLFWCFRERKIRSECISFQSLLDKLLSCWFQADNVIFFWNSN